ncbi:DUF3375 domain-containing protein [Scandinavium sp. H11S7]|uniref:DUF3375 domain-containing protein n=1 Tax=Scandinavium hiltneri TaxID=2926519 RepID=UPI0021669F17|nr:DUF3375 domain-containing protein [Scandinavium hiltneri]MCS2157694.1 DUF3375 domain-containing protein [Scandinavium hiltneri]
MDYTTLNTLLSNHPAWRLLRADSAPLIASFLWHAFSVPNARSIPQSELVERLEDSLYILRQQYGDKFAPRPAQDYLNEWAAPEKAWLRKFYPPGDDTPWFDLTPATEKALSWLDKLADTQFVGTESRLVTLFELLKQVVSGSEEDPEIRIRELETQRNNIDKEIAAIRAGNMTLLDSTAQKERFQQIMQLSRELLGDFRQVEHNFRQLDRNVREQIALWDGAKGSLLHQILGERDVITESDQGRSFRAFWDFLMSQSRQEEFSLLLEKTLSLEAIAELNPDARTRRIHYDWLEAGEHTQRTVALLSQQLRRFLDDRAWLENKRIMDILHSIEHHAIALKEAPPDTDIMDINTLQPDIILPFERPLYSPAVKARIIQQMLENGDEDIDINVLFSQNVVDKTRLLRNIRLALQTRTQISFSELLHHYPIQQGLAEVITYIQLASESITATVDEQIVDTLTWTTAKGEEKRAMVNRIIFTRSQEPQNGIE